MTRMRISPARLAALSSQLSQRDLDVVASLARLRLARTGQLQRLHFDQGSPLTQARRCRHALERLVQLGVLARLDRRIGGVRAGSAGFVYALGPVGQRLNGGHGPAGGQRVRRPWTPSLPFVAHRLAVTELFVALVERQRAGQCDVLRFDAEPAAWRRFTGPAGSVVTLKPDAYVVTALGEYEYHRFVEVDRATEGAATIAAKLRVYRQYWASGREQHEHGVFPGTLFVVPDGHRARAISGEIASQPAETRFLFDVVVWTEAVTRLAGGES